jgi:hypothetical protein
VDTTVRTCVLPTYAISNRGRHQIPVRRYWLPAVEVRGFNDIGGCRIDDAVETRKEHEDTKLSATVQEVSHHDN